MRTYEKKPKHTSSAWHLLFKIGAYIILVFALPLLAAKSYDHDKIDKFGDSVEGQFAMLVVVLTVISMFALTWIVKKYKEWRNEA